MLTRSLFVLTLLLSEVCFARDGVFLDLSHRLNYVTFVEWDKGYPINEESGSLPSQSFAIGYQKRNQFYFEYIHTEGENSIGYVGYSQLGNLVETRTDYTLQSDQYIFGKTFESTVVYLGYEVNTRDRSILGTSYSAALNEYIKQKQGFVGFKQNIVDSNRFVVDFRFNAKMAFSSYMNVDFDDTYDESGVHLGIDYTLVSSLFIGANLPQNWLVGGNFMYEFTEIEQSDPVALTRDGDEYAGEFYHPYSELETVTLGLTVSKSF